MGTVFQAGFAVVRQFCLLNARWLAAVFATAIAMTVAGAPAVAADPIAEIGLLRTAHVGQDVRLQSIGQNVPEVHFSWALDGRPKLSKAKISDRNSEQTSFRADVPGVYLVRLTVRLRNQSATYALEVTATEPGPLVSVNTIDTTQGSSPVTWVGSQPYTDTVTQGKGFHVVVVDRNHLGYINNTGFALTQAGIQSMQNYFGTLKTDGSVLVLVSLPASAGPIPSNLLPPCSSSSDNCGSVSTALNKIGGVIPEAWTYGYTNAALRTCWSSMQMQCYFNNPVWQVSSAGWNGSFSVIGVPGMTVGNAWYDDAKQRGTTDGPLVGYLTTSFIVNSTGIVSTGNPYSFVFGSVNQGVVSGDQYTIVDTCASGGPSACAIQVGGKSYPPKNGNGMTVLLLDRVTLTPLVYETVTTTAELYANLFYSTTRWASGHFFFGPSSANASTLNATSDRTILILQSVGNGLLSVQPLASSGDISLFNQTALLQAIDQMGGTPETFGTPLQSGGAGPGAYALVGVASSLPWHGKGIESSPSISSTQPGRSRGVLSRDRYARYTPTSFDPQGTAILDMASIIYQPLQTWPYDGNCVIQYIAEQLGLPTDVPPIIRSGYTDLLKNWNDEQTPLGKVAYPASPPSYCTASNPFPDESTFNNTILPGLSDEFTWVEDTKTFIQTLMTPFTVEGSTDTIVKQVASSVFNTVQPPSTSTSVPWVAIADVAFAVVGVAVPEAQGVLGVMATSLTLGTDFIASSSTANPARQFIAQTNQVAAQLDNQTKAYELWLTSNLQTILLTDYGKLSTVGKNIDDLTWDWTSEATSTAVGMLSATTAQTAYSAFLPTAWPLVQLKPDLITQFHSDDVTQFICLHPDNWADPYVNDPFGHELIQNQFSSLFLLIPQPAGQGESATHEVWTFAKYDIYDSFTSRPTSSVTDGLFTTSVDAGGAGAYPPAWYRSTYNPPDFVRCGSTSSHSSTEQHPAPATSPTAAGYTLG